MKLDTIVKLDAGNSWVSGFIIVKRPSCCSFSSCSDTSGTVIVYRSSSSNFIDGFAFLFLYDPLNLSEKATSQFSRNKKKESFIFEFLPLNDDR